MDAGFLTSTGLNGTTSQELAIRLTPIPSLKKMSRGSNCQTSYGLGVLRHVLALLESWLWTFLHSHSMTYSHGWSLSVCLSLFQTKVAQPVTVPGFTTMVGDNVSNFWENVGQAWCVFVGPTRFLRGKPRWCEARLTRLALGGMAAYVGAELCWYTWGL